MMVWAAKINRDGDVNLLLPILLKREVLIILHELYNTYNSTYNEVLTILYELKTFLKQQLLQSKTMLSK